jgi:UPF0755 protein
MKKVILFVVLAAFAGCVAAGWIGYRKVTSYPSTPRKGDGTIMEVVVPPDVGPVGLCALLEEKGVIDDHAWFCWYMRYIDAYPKVQAGSHLIANNLSPDGVLAALAVKPLAKDVALTLVPGTTCHEMAPRLEEAGVGKAADLVALCGDGAAAARLTGLGGLRGLEGFLFPDTYRFRPGAGAAAVAATTTAKMKETLAALRTAYPAGVARLATLKWGDREWVTLASIVQEETGPADDPRDVAAVFLNRMTDPKFVPHRLDSDPTVIYGLGPTFTGDLTRAMLDDASNPYNTYTHEGLPPGPIASPGRGALAAVVDPAPRKYLFFVATGTGKSYFSDSYAEHAKAVDCFQLHKCAPGFPPKR